MPSGVAKLLHARLGLCELVRVEGTDWIVAAPSGIRFRFPSERRCEFREVAETPSDGESVVSNPPISYSPYAPDFGTPILPRTPCAPDNARMARRVVESLRIGLPPFDSSTQQFAVGFRLTEQVIGSFLETVSSSGSGLIVKGAYGQGKTFFLSILEELALQKGFLTARAEIDTLECPLNKPHLVYRHLVNSLRIPGESSYGITTLVRMANRRFLQEIGSDPDVRFASLKNALGCVPMAWLLSDPAVDTKAPLLALLRAETDRSLGFARRSHCRPDLGRDLWPRFYARNQADFAVNLLSGISCLACALGYGGLIILLDEAEKYFQLRGYDRDYGTNLLGGLIWAASAGSGRRGRTNEPAGLFHSGGTSYSSGGMPGIPFTTEQPAHLGVAIALTPGHGQQPDQLLGPFGQFSITEAPVLTREGLFEYCCLLSQYYATAFGLSPPNDGELRSIASEAADLWRRTGNLTNRSGAQAVIAAFDNWRNNSGRQHAPGQADGIGR